MSPPDQPRAPRRLPLGAIIVALVCVWIPATLFFGGDLGFWNDDYFLCQRNPQTGDADAWRTRTPNPFRAPTDGILWWRPLHHVFVTTALNLTWTNHRPLYIFGALLHLTNAVLVVALFRRLGRSWQAQAAAGVVFLAWPAAFEIFQWASAFSTCVATGLLLGASLAFIAWARGARARHACLFIALACLIPWLNEQPAGALIAMPALFLAVRRPDEPLRRAAWRIAWPLGVVLAWCVVYALTTRAWMPTADDSGAIVMTRLRDVPREVRQVTNRLLQELVRFRTVKLGPVRQGWIELKAHPALAAGSSVLVLGALGAIARSWFAPSPGTPKDREGLGRPAGPAWVILAGLLVYVGTAIPIAALPGVLIRPRMVYGTLIGGLLIVLVLGDVATSIVARTRLRAPWVAYHAIALAVLAAVTAFGATSLIGTQSGYHHRGRIDRAGAAALRALIPDPAPNSFFLPLKVEDAPIRSGVGDFDWYYVGPWYWAWSFPTYIKHAYARTDLDAGHWPAPIPLADEGGVRFAGDLRPGLRDTPGQRGRWFSWDQVVPIVIEPDGTPRLVLPVVIERDGLPPLRVEPPQVLRAMRERGVTPVEGVIRPGR